MDVLDRYLAAVLPLIDVDQIVETAVELAHVERPSDFGSFEKSAATLRQRFRSAGISSEISGHWYGRASARAASESWSLTRTAGDAL